jgi:hypothetical protein
MYSELLSALSATLHSSHELVAHLCHNPAVVLQGRRTEHRELGLISCRVRISQDVEGVQLEHVCNRLSLQHPGCAAHITACHGSLNACYHLVSCDSRRTSLAHNRDRVHVLIGRPCSILMRRANARRPRECEDAESE